MTTETKTLLSVSLKLIALAAILVAAALASSCDANEFTQTEQTRQSTLLAVAKGGNAPEGPGADGNKPLMRNRAPIYAASAMGHTASNTLPPGLKLQESLSPIIHPRLAGWSGTAAELLTLCQHIS